MEIYTIGFAQKSAEAFFSALRQSGVRRLIDVRLHNRSQLAGFTKQADLRYFLRELCQVEYEHEPRLAPTADLREAYRRQKIGWPEYRERFLRLLAERQAGAVLAAALRAGPTVLLCSEPSAEYCHRRLVAEYCQELWGDVVIRHL